MRAVMKNMWGLWRDESGLVVSAEAVTVGTVGVLAAVVGMSTFSSAVDSELKEMASAFRSLDQSFIYTGHRGSGAWTAGSYYIQPSTQLSVSDLEPATETELRAIQRRIDEERKAFSQPLAPALRRIEPSIEPTPVPKPNQIPEPERKPNEPTPQAPNA